MSTADIHTETAGGAASHGPSADAVADPLDRPSRPSLDDLLQADEGTYEFFTRPPVAPEEPVSWHPPAPMSHENRRAMRWALAMLAGFAVAIGGYFLYHEFLMPTPVALGGASVSDIPSPLVPMQGARASSGSEATPSTPAAREPGAAQPDAPGASGSSDAQQGEQHAVSAANSATPDGAHGAQAAGGENALAAAASETTDAPAAASGQKETVGATVAAGTADQAGAGYLQAMLEAADLQKNGHFDRALAAYQEALSVRPSAPEALAKIGYLHLNARRNEEARAAAERAVAADPTNSEGWIVLGAARQMLGDRAGAKQAYRECAAQAVGDYVVECRRMAR